MFDLLGGLVQGASSALFGGLSSALFGSDNGDISDQLANAQAVSSISSSMQGSNVPSSSTVAPSSTSGSQNSSMIYDMSKDAFTAGVQSVVGAGTSKLVNELFGKSASELGSDNRAYLDASFPELNAWEKSGASATSMGVQAGNQLLQSRMQEKQFAQERFLQKQQLDTTERVAELNASTQLASAETSISPAMAKLDYEIAQIVANTDLTRAEAESALLSDEQRLADILSSAGTTTGAVLGLGFGIYEMMKGRRLRSRAGASGSSFLGRRSKSKRSSRKSYGSFSSKDKKTGGISFGPSIVESENRWKDLGYSNKEEYLKDKRLVDQYVNSISSTSKK